MYLSFVETVFAEEKEKAYKTQSKSEVVLSNRNHRILYRRIFSLAKFTPVFAW
jgi:hypothetical protein